MKSRAAALLLWCALPAVVLCALPVLAADKKPSVAQLLTVADDAFEHGFFSDALSAYQDAYGRSGAAALLLKVGACHEKLTHWQEAANAYRRYVASEPALSASERAELESKAAALEARTRPKAPLPPALVAAPPPLVLAPAPVGQQRGLGRALTVDAIATAAVALVAGGVTIGAANRFSRLTADCRADAPGCSDGARDRVLALDHAADSLWAVAAAGAVAALTLQLILRRERRLHSAVEPSSGGARASLGFDF